MFEPVNVEISIQNPTSSSIGYIRDYHEHFKSNPGCGLDEAQNAGLTDIILDLDSPYSSKQSNVVLHASFTPANNVGSVVWSSSNTDVATVDPNTGLVTAVGHGRATITARSNLSAETDSINVIVPNALMDVELDLQETRNWCWVTSVRMIMKYYFPNLSATQDEAVEYAKGSVLDEGGSATEANDAAIYYSGGRVEYHSISFPDENTLRGLLDDGIPLYLSERWAVGNTSNGHARVIYGYYEYSPGVYVYLIHDPYQWVGSNIYIKTQMSYTNLCDEQEIGIADIDKKPINNKEWFPGNILYWTVTA